MTDPTTTATNAPAEMDPAGAGPSGTGDLWNYRHDIEVPTDELVGYDVEATDGHIGSVDEASVVHDDAHLVVDTGFWIFGKRRVIPAAAVRQIDADDRVIFLDMTKQEVSDAPDHHDTWSDDEHRPTLVEYYQPFVF